MKLSAQCKFEGYLDDALQDRLVCGLHDESIQRWLLTPLSLHKVWRQSLETQEMKGAAMSIKVVVTPPHEGGFAKGNLACIVGKQTRSPQPVFSRIPSANIAGNKATWPMYAGLRRRPQRVTDTQGKIRDGRGTY